MCSVNTFAVLGLCDIAQKLGVAHLNLLTSVHEQDLTMFSENHMMFNVLSFFLGVEHHLSLCYCHNFLLSCW